MPQYMLLIYQPAGGAPTPDDPGEDMASWLDYRAGLQDAGAWVASAPLEAADTATTVRVRDGETLVTDGPFAETKELLAGYFLLDCPDLDAALAHAARVPNIHYGSVEVRPVVGVPART